MQSETFHIPAMDNQAVANFLANAVANAPGVTGVRISTAAKRMQVSYDETAFSSADLHALLERTGYQAGAAKESGGGCCGGCGGAGSCK
ncbi:MAG: heavy-metal-associated domain-containing protein [Pseudomonadota bacterium]